MKRKLAIKLVWLVALTGLLCGATAGAFLVLTKDLPQIIALENYRPSAITRIYSSDQVLIGELYAEKRDPIPLSKIPDTLIAALLTTEDRRFYQHKGINFKGILRAIVQNLRKGRYAQGGSTLTQQLAKTLFLSPRKTMIRKLREAILALQLERRYTKDELLALYLNQIYLGSGAYGVASAAQVYFDKAPTELTLSQCALIAGLPKSPSRYSPLVNPDLALKRRNIVLKQMVATGAITQAAYETAIADPLIASSAPKAKSAAHYFIGHIRQQLEDTVGADRLYKGGLTVHTTLSKRLQDAAVDAVTQGLTQLDDRRAGHKLIEPSPQAALLAVDVTTGGILAMIGGRPEGREEFNRATMARRQPGSAFKPMVYALAVEQEFNQHQTLLDAPIVFQSPDRRREWQPENFSKRYDGEVTMRFALAHSKNIPVVRLMEKLGPSSVIRFSQTLGMKSINAPNLSLALGTSETTLIELTAAYAVFANQGKFIAPYGVTAVIDNTGHTIWKAKPKQRLAMSRASAAIMTDMLESVVQEGTGRRAQVLPPPVAGKTGTTNEYRDALFVGFTPSVATGVWVGNDDATTLGPKETGARAALPIWIDFMQAALERQSQRYFDLPDTVQRIHINTKTGETLDATHPQAIPVLVRPQPLPSS